VTMADGMTSFEEKGMLAIITISGSTGMILHFAYGVPWFSAGAVPTHVVCLLGIGLPLLFALVAFAIKKEKITQYSSFNDTAYIKELENQAISASKNTKKKSMPSFDSEAAFNAIPYLPEVTNLTVYYYYFF
jgi:hypothetical protein